jgi:hypothetical protein
MDSAAKPDRVSMRDPGLTAIGSIVELERAGFAAFTLGPVYVYGSVKEDLCECFAGETGRDVRGTRVRFDRPIMGVKGDAPMASKHDGVATTSVITTVAESPAMPGVVWVGTNDGNLQVSRDGGLSWKNVVANVKGVPATLKTIRSVNPGRTRSAFRSARSRHALFSRAQSHG